MSFSDRTLASDILIQKLIDYYWSLLSQQINLIHEPYGYETHISERAQNLLKRDYSTTAKHIRFTPDYILSRRENNYQKTILLEYKVTKTPRFTLRDKQWNVGQIEADAWDNYMNLVNAQVEVAILIYCPYHSRPLLCDYPSLNWLINTRQQTRNSAGSGTDFVNINLHQIRSFDDFMANEFGVDQQYSQSLLSRTFFYELMNDENLQTNHHWRSHYKDNVTGFNWDERYR